MYDVLINSNSVIIRLPVLIHVHDLRTRCLFSPVSLSLSLDELAAITSQQGSDFLVIIFDLNPRAWHAHAKRMQDGQDQLNSEAATTAAASAGTDTSSESKTAAAVQGAYSLTSVLDQLMIFINAFLLLQRSNDIAMITYHPEKAYVTTCSV
jgi:hypothetical protein